MLADGYLLDKKYEIKELLGSGGGGNVYRAFHRGLQKYVAVKEIKDEVKDVLDNRVEADTLKNLKNDYIPIVYDFIREGGNVYTVMEYVEGSSFQSLLDSGRKFSQRETVNYSLQLCMAAAYLHSRRPPVIHSDIKPANIMLKPDGSICLIDYNISLFLNGDAKAVGVSDGYSPPEQYTYIPKKRQVSNELAPTVYDDGKTAADVNGSVAETKYDDSTLLTKSGEDSEKSDKLRVCRVDARSDVYAIGATMLHIASGKRPAVSTDGEAVDYTADGKLSESLAAIIAKAMDPEPSKRFADAGQMLKAMKNLKKYDRRYKAMLARQEIAVLLVAAAMGISGIVSVIGYRRTGEETQELYSKYVALIDGDNKYFQMAEKLYPDRCEAYEKQAAELFESGDYEKTAEFIEGIANKGELVDVMGESYRPAELYRLLGRCRMEEENYPAAVSAYEDAVAYGNDDPDNYCDYSVALARCGRVADAENALDIAIKHGLSDDSIMFAKGEIGFASGEYSQAVNDLKKCISVTNNADLRYRAYIIGGNAYAAAFSEDNSIGGDRIDFLTSALDDAPIEKSAPFYEMLGQAYIDEAQASGNNAYYAQAVSIYEKMNDAGWESFESDYALIRLYRILGNYEYAKKLALGVMNSGGDEYTICKLLAYIETDIQSKKPERERNYSEFEGYYRRAQALCTDNEDFEMQRLDDAYQQMKKEGFLNG